MKIFSIPFYRFADMVSPSFKVLVPCLFLLAAQVRPTEGYDKVKWGASSAEVIRVYDITNAKLLTNHWFFPGSSGGVDNLNRVEPDCTYIMQDGVGPYKNLESDTIAYRYFHFHNDKLYQVNVIYQRRVSDDDIEATLTERYGQGRVIRMKIQSGNIFLPERERIIDGIFNKTPGVLVTIKWYINGEMYGGSVVTYTNIDYYERYVKKTTPATPPKKIQL